MHVRIAAAVSLTTRDRSLLDAAVGDDAAPTRALDCVVAEGWAVFPARAPRVRVLEKAGFSRDGENLDGDVGLVWRFGLDRHDTRDGVRSSRRAIGR